ncbi:uncharacterized protein K02A2.6-like [Photinus pyralis]|uniref:uncharacterized protein K02A2.6-like n=1 Tax=Photinus pyralis TaxID=7054 RepID=UPI001266FA7E|nr:uncharacterized protein K02A2.6-like [Photinus pyralis]
MSRVVKVLKTVLLRRRLPVGDCFVCVVKTFADVDEDDDFSNHVLLSPFRAAGKRGKVVKKKDGKPRFCVDYRRLNAITKDESSNLPVIHETLRDLGTAKIFSTLDLKSGYWQVPLDDASKPLTAFTTHDGAAYQFRVMPFGLKIAPATFQKLMTQEVLPGYLHKFAMVYLDDIIVYSQTWEEHLHHLHLVLERFQHHRLRLSVKKCRFGVQSIQYLGHTIEADGNKPLREHVEAIRTAEAPKTRNQHSASIIWVLRLQEFSFDVIHCPGKENELPDYLSRNPTDRVVEENTEEDISRLLPPPSPPADTGPPFLANIEVAELVDRVKTTGPRTPPKTVSSGTTLPTTDISTANPTERDIYSHYHWPKMGEDVRNYVRNCWVCTVAKRGPIQEATVRPRQPSRPWEVISVDLMGPYTTSHRGNRFILVVTDLYSMWVEAFPLRLTTTDAVVNRLENEVLGRYGFPRAIVSDNGPQFISVTWDAALRHSGCYHWTTPIFHPQANPVERRNQEIKKGLRIHLDGEALQMWDRKVPIILFTLRTRKNAATGTTPSNALLGYELSRPGEWHATQAPATPIGQGEEREEPIRTVHRNQHRYRSRYANFGPTRVQFQAGDEVWRDPETSQRENFSENGKGHIE